jgi:hypothetical protein
MNFNIPFSIRRDAALLAHLLRRALEYTKVLELTSFVALSSMMQFLSLWQAAAQSKSHLWHICSMSAANIFTRSAAPCAAANTSAESVKESVRRQNNNLDEATIEAIGR